MTTSTGESRILHADVELTQRLERTEGIANAAFITARASVDPATGAAWTAIADVYAMYDGPGSPLTQTFGLGAFGEIHEPDFLRIERFFAERGATVQHEVSPFLSADTLALLVGRNYRPCEFSNVLVRPTAAGTISTGGPAIREIGIDEGLVWAWVAAKGWSSESEELASFVAAFGHVATRAEGFHCFLAEQDGRPIAAAALSLHNQVGIFAGASTVPSARRRGAQQALLEHRLRFAAERGAELAMVVAAPGSGSQRNAERHGFQVAYTRTKWVGAFSGRA